MHGLDLGLTKHRQNVQASQIYQSNHSSGSLFKLRFTLSYRDVEELLKIRRVKVNHSTLQRWVFKFSPLIKANMNKRKRRVCDSWRMDDTYVKVGGKDRYLFGLSTSMETRLISCLPNEG